MSSAWIDIIKESVRSKIENEMTEIGDNPLYNDQHTLLAVILLTIDEVCKDEIDKFLLLESVNLSKEEIINAVNEVEVTIKTQIIEHLKNR